MKLQVLILSPICIKTLLELFILRGVESCKVSRLLMKLHVVILNPNCNKTVLELFILRGVESRYSFRTPHEASGSYFLWELAVKSRRCLGEILFIF